ncbi:SH3 domain-containing protein [Pseudoroseicyclus tamaricis]|uniref:SH3 domain-containing protein n=1 Tax=Pseudoroseicyclus tamaricis TaxID=2705421 RepID=A0A6B2K2N5_9RHOB|nr:SH3 domain-containing protein [Pseudoroseicyclus tamaricis]NDV02854.1 SH3 domain-containing protein [Pseudoroseicyclus tamaricis]
MRWLALLLTLWAGMAGATTEEALPALYDVAGVAADDVLNLREGPGVEHAVIGELAPGAESVEVTALSEDGGWGRVNVEGRSGWASMAYLERQPGQYDSFPPGIAACFGTEPFWRLEETGDGWQVTLPGEPAVSWAPGLPADPMGRPGVFAWLGEDGAGALVVARESCSDGMSDRLFGLSAALVTAEGGAVLRTGCCSLVE